MSLNISFTLCKMGMKSGPCQPASLRIKQSSLRDVPDTPGTGSRWEVLGGNGKLEGEGWEELNVKASECQACQIGSDCAS